MSELTLNLSDYKSSGVYFVEIDNSIVQGSVNSALRLAIGYNEQGPFNRPVYVSSTADCDELLGDIDLKLERRGCYTNRNIRTMVSVAPVYALNILPVDTSSSSNKDKSGYSAVSFDTTAENKNGEIPFCEMYDRTKFWVTDADAMMNGVISDMDINDSDETSGALFAFGNVGTKDISLIVRKAENLTGYNVTFLDWYGSEDAIPYNWINPYDYVADYFVQVIAVNGNYTNYQTYANDSNWKTYFDANGLKKDALNKFLRLDAVTVIGNWIGCIIPDFYDKQGKCRSIDYLINKTTNKTGLQFGVNKTALETLFLKQDMTADASTLADGVYKPYFFLDVNGSGTPEEENAATVYHTIDMTGMNITKDTSHVNFMSYDIDITPYDADSTPATNYCMEMIYTTVDKTSKCTFTYTPDKADPFTPAVGDYVRAENGTLTRIIKKRVTLEQNSDGDTITQMIFTTISPVCTFDYKNVLRVNALFQDDKNIVNTPVQANETGEEGDQPYYVNMEDISDTDKDNDSVIPCGVEIHRSITSLYTNLKFIELKGLKITNRLRPGYNKDGMIDIEAGIEKIYSFLEDSGIRKGLLNNDIIDFRYIVDTMGGGLGGYDSSNNAFNGKKYLSELAADKGRCTALLNLPSMSDFAASTAPIFCDDYQAGSTKPAFNVEYIAKGGNMDHAYTSQCAEFELPVSSEEGAKYTAFFAPYLKYKHSSRTVLIPPAADVCNTFMSKYLGGNPYATIANKSGVLNNTDIIGVEYNFDKADRDALEPFGVNPIIERGNAIMIYGDRTAYQTVNSDFNFLHVRELLNTLEVRCKAVLDDYPFTYNNANTRAEIVSRLNPILSAMKDSGALAKYEIQMDELNNTQDIIDEKFGIVDIGVWVTPNMEKIITRITVNRGSTAD